jgi:glucan 1,3-beta-glucosidase
VFDKTKDTRIVDEWTFGQYQDKHVARAALEKHWSTFITKDDFRQIQEAGYVLLFLNANLLHQ